MGMYDDYLQGIELTRTQLFRLYLQFGILYKQMTPIIVIVINNQ